MPVGIRVWGERAARAGGIDATLGVITAPPTLLGAAGDADTIAYLPGVREAFSAWTPAEVFPYAPVAGLPAFRERWRSWLSGKSAAGSEAGIAAGSGSGAAAGSEAGIVAGSAGPTDPRRLTLPVATSGVTGALCAAGLLVTDPGDRILVPDRRWDGYDTTFGAVCGARVRPVRLLEGGAWDLAAWSRALRETARLQDRIVFVLNFPHNPTGYVPSAAEVEGFAEAVVEAVESAGVPAVAICDDAYEGYVYTDRPRASAFHRLVDRHPLLLPIKCDGITKELLFWGGRLGAATTAFPSGWSDAEREEAAAAWESKASAVTRGMISSASTAVQALVARLLADPDAVVEARRPVMELLSKRREALSEALESPAARAAFEADPFHGGLFALLNLRRGDAVDVAERLLERKIGVVPFRDESIDLNALRVTYATVPTESIFELISVAAGLAAGTRRD